MAASVIRVRTAEGLGEVPRPCAGGQLPSVTMQRAPRRCSTMTAATRVEDPSAISDHVEAGKGVLWVDATDPTRTTAQDPGRVLLHPLAMEDLRHPGSARRSSATTPRASSSPTPATATPSPVRAQHLHRRRVADLGAPLQGATSASTCSTWPSGSSAPGRPQHGRLPAVHDPRRVVDTYFDAFDNTEDGSRPSRPHLPDDRPHEQVLQQDLLTCAASCPVPTPGRPPATCCRSSSARRSPARATPALLPGRARPPPAGHRHARDPASCSATRSTPTSPCVNNHMNDIMKKMTSWGAILFGARWSPASTA